MSTLEDRFHEEVEQLKTLRDELRVQAELGKMDAVEAFNHAEKRWEELEGKLTAIRKQTEEPLHEVGEAAKALVLQRQRSSDLNVLATNTFPDRTSVAIPAALFGIWCILTASGLIAVLRRRNPAASA